MPNENVLEGGDLQVFPDDKYDKIEVRDKILRTPPRKNQLSVINLDEHSGKITPPGNLDKLKEATSIPNKGQSGKTSPKSTDNGKLNKESTGKSNTSDKKSKSDNQTHPNKDSSQKPNKTVHETTKELSQKTKDKTVKPSAKREKSVNTRDNSTNKQNTAKKNRQHQSRSMQKLKSSENRRSSSSAKRPREETSEDENSEQEIETEKTDESMQDDDKANESIICPICEKGFAKDDSCIYCGCCRRWFHAACQGITEEEITAFRVLKKLAHYFCPQCSVGASELYTAQVKCREKVERLEKRVEEIAAENVEMDGSIKTLQSQQTKNTASIKTLDTVHKTLRQDMNETSNSVKTLKTNEKSLREDVDKCKISTQTNSTKINAVVTRLDTIQDDIISRMNTIIDDRVENKLKQLGSVPDIPTPAIDENVVDDKLEKLLKEKVDNIHNEELLKQKLDNKLSEKVDNLSAEYTHTHMEIDGSSNKPIVSRVFTSAVNSVVSEREEIERRKLQVVITGLTENHNPEHDQNDAKEIFTLMKCNIKIVESMRVGKVKRERPRPLRITVENLTDKRTLLAKATSLRNIPATHKFAKVYVKPNLTIQQQEQSKNLQVELQEIRLKNPQKRYKITKGKIVEVETPNLEDN